MLSPCGSSSDAGADPPPSLSRGAIAQPHPGTRGSAIIEINGSTSPVLPSPPSDVWEPGGMRTYLIETTIAEDGRLTLTGIPFPVGERV
jgi:hypothetical protein